ncbi:MAG: hypothetical protein VR73_15615 [Gammaproteobacteria bacterium BRH_c0]|nr:MAG: hypothetical protein VR73_15615 [Gammaproteobacteria bacterium BRH_c0]
MTRTLLALLLLALPTLSLAQTRYVTDALRVPLRSSPCATCSIVHQGLTPGTALTVINTEDEWTRVTTAQGANGWLPNHYLVNTPVAPGREAAIDANTDSLKSENAQLKNELRELQVAYDALEAEYSLNKETLSALEVELSTVKKISNNALTLQEQNEELIKRSHMLQSEIDVLTASRDQLQSDNTQRWFMYGGIAVFLGALLATLLPSLRPRRRYSEWG